MDCVNNENVSKFIRLIEILCAARTCLLLVKFQRAILQQFLVTLQEEWQIERGVKMQRTTEEDLLSQLNKTDHYSQMAKLLWGN